MTGIPSSKVIPDTSVIIDGLISKLVLSGKLKNCEIITPIAVLDELQAQASKHREHGFLGLEELKKLGGLPTKFGVTLSYKGEKPTLEDIRLAGSGRIDAIIRDVARKVNGTLYTADYVQALVAEALGVSVSYIPVDVKTEGLEFEKYFDESTLSIHLKEEVTPRAKKGKPGSFKLVELDKKPLTRVQMKRIVTEIVEAARVTERSVLEVKKEGAQVIQFGTYRIAVTRPPFSDRLEVTVVRPLVRLGMEDYQFSPKLLGRIKSRAEGIVIAGPPGSGKTTLASSLADYYAAQGKIVKTFESPKELQVSPTVTQYGPLEHDFKNTAEILLLVRPDYTIFDEVRKDGDFQTFADMRLAGVGMVGVVHASNSINAVQRFISRVELGMITSIIDTVIFLIGGRIEKVYELRLSVKVPSGMIEADLARPVIDVLDFEDGKLEFEIYTFGEENVVVPVSTASETGNAVRRLAAERIREVVKRFDPGAVVKVISDTKASIKVDKSVIPKIIGRKGAVIADLEDILGIKIDVEATLPSLGEVIPFDLKETGNSMDLIFIGRGIGKLVNFYIESDFLFSATVGRKGKIKVSKSSQLGKKLVNAVLSRSEIKAVLQP
jgi:ATPase